MYTNYASLIIGALYFSGVLVEYFEDSKSSSTKTKERYCWIQNGVFNVAKIIKTKPIKQIDLSTVVLLDESDVTKNKFAFKLEYTNSSNGSNGKRNKILLRALDAILADKWMVAVSMGILYHRLSGSSSSTSQQRLCNQDSDNDGDHGGYDFVPLSIPEARSPREKSRTESDLSNKEAPLRKEIAEKLGREDRDSLKIVEHMLSDEKDGNGGGDEQVTDEEKTTLPDMSLPLVTDEESTPGLLKTQLSNLNDEEDQVFDGVTVEQNFEILESIPEKENADQAFRNVEGILHQQESIRRTILRNQREKRASTTTNSSVTDDSGSQEKRVPPPVKRKPSKLVLRKPTFNEGTVINQMGSVDQLSLTKLHAYAEKLGVERNTLSKCVKELNSLLSMAVVVSQGDAETQHENENSITSHEHKHLKGDLDYYKERLSHVDKELKTCRMHITRRTASKSMGAVVSPEIHKRPHHGGVASGRHKVSTSTVNRNGDYNESIAGGEVSEVLDEEDNNLVVLREKQGRQNSTMEDVESIII